MIKTMKKLKLKLKNKTNILIFKKKNKKKMQEIPKRRQTPVCLSVCLSISGEFLQVQNFKNCDIRRRGVRVLNFKKGPPCERNANDVELRRSDPCAR